MKINKLKAHFLSPLIGSPFDLEISAKDTVGSNRSFCFVVGFDSSKSHHSIRARFDLFKCQQGNKSCAYNIYNHFPEYNNKSTIYIRPYNQDKVSFLQGLRNFYRTNFNYYFQSVKISNRVFEIS